MNGKRYLLTIRMGLIVMLVMMCGLVATDQESVDRSPPRVISSAEFAALLEKCGASNRAERYEATRAAWDALDRSHAAQLREMLEMSVIARVRAGAASMLGHLRDRAATAALINAMQNDESFHVRRDAARSLGMIGGRDGGETRDALMVALNGDSDSSVRKYAAAALGTIGDATAIRALEESVARQDDDEVRIVICQTLARKNAPAHRVAPVRIGEVTEGSHAGTRYLMFVPSTYRRDQPPPVLASIHGTHGDAEHYLEVCRADAERAGVIIIAPHFDYGSFPDFGNLNPWPGWERADLRLLAIIDEIAQRVPMQSERLLLFGHSQGGQFVHRFVLAHPDRVARAAACAGGNYVHPNEDDPFPYGIAPNPLMEDVGTVDFDRLVTMPLAIVIGDKDEQRRLDEAQRFMEEVNEYAGSHDLESKVELHIVPDGPHRGTSNWPPARDYLFRDLASRP